MAKVKIKFECGSCGAISPVKVGKCGNCGSFGTYTQKNEGGLALGSSPQKGRNLKEFTQKDTRKFTNEKCEVPMMPELNRVLGGGFEPGSVVLLAGEPGVGKSTLALQMAAGFASSIYFSGEESANQVQKRAKRLRLAQEFPVYFTQRLDDIYATTKLSDAEFVVMDSVQTLRGANSLAGGLASAREVADFALMMSKELQKTVLLIGHVTKGGDIAGPRSLEHLVDVVLELRGDRTTELRLLKSPKNRFGSTQETGVFLFTEKGFMSVENPSKYFLSSEGISPPGTVISTQKEGNRHFFFELQALAVKTNFGQPRRSSSGFDLSRMGLLLAVIERFTTTSLAEFDVYANIVGGIRVNERASDLAFCSAVISSRLHKPLPEKTLCLGEVGLSGEVRTVPGINERIKEAQRLGFTKIIGPVMKEKPEMSAKIKYHGLKSINELQKELFSV